MDEILCALIDEGRRRPRRRRKHPEQDIQKAIIRYLRVVIVPPTVFTSIAHGGYALSLVHGKQLKASGLVPGLPDLLIVSGGIAHWCEVKTATGKLSEAQERTHELLRAAGCPVSVVRSIDDVAASLRLWGIPTREAKPSPVTALAADLRLRS